MIISDFHVHFHHSYDKEVFFNSIKKNFEKNCINENIDCTKGIICLTESAGTSFFNELCSFCDNNLSVKLWSFRCTSNKNTVIAEHVSGFEIYVVAGRQIVTEENLEVLAIGMIDEIENGKPIESVIDFIVTNGFIPIIPWGFGKWSGTRGEIVKSVINNIHQTLFLGDNGNRPNFINQPSVFEQAKAKKIYNLQGSDPLPFNNEDQRPGSFGVIINDNIDPYFPFESFLKVLTNEHLEIKSYGKLESPFKFFKHQIGMQIVKRLRK